MECVQMWLFCAQRRVDLYINWQEVCVWIVHTHQVDVSTFICGKNEISIYAPHTFIGCLRLQVIFRKRATINTSSWCVDVYLRRGWNFDSVIVECANVIIVCAMARGFVCELTWWVWTWLQRACTFTYKYTNSLTGWRRVIGCLKLQVIFRKRATMYRALWRKMTWRDEASYDSTAPCNTHSFVGHLWLNLVRQCTASANVYEPTRGVNGVCVCSCVCVCLISPHVVISKEKRQYELNGYKTNSHTTYHVPKNMYECMWSDMGCKWIHSHMQWFKERKDNTNCMDTKRIPKLRITYQRKYMNMGWLRLVGCLKIYVSLQNIGLFCRALLHQRPMFLSILPIVATPYLIFHQWIIYLTGFHCVFVNPWISNTYLLTWKTLVTNKISALCSTFYL